MIESSKSKIVFLGLFLAAALFFGCVQQTPTGEKIQPTAEGNAPQVHYVSIAANATDLGILKINVGDTVVWTNNDPDLTHTVEFSGDASPELKQGASWSKTFEQKGTFKYGDGLYGVIEGTIVVK